MSTNVRTYGSYLEKAIIAIQSGIDRANSINDPYYREGSLILISNAWELLSKALLIKHGGETLIFETGSKKERSITAETAINKLKNLGYLVDIQTCLVQQIISLRNEATHSILPSIPDEIVFHLEYYGIKYFKEILEVNFKKYAKKFRNNYLSISFDSQYTYVDRVKRLLSKAKSSKGADPKRLSYLLERGVAFDGSEYIKQSDFDKILLDKKTTRPMYKFKIGDYSRKAEMIVVVPIQAPSGTQADIKLSKTNNSSITVKFDKRATDDDYPYLTSDLSSKLGISRPNVSKIIKELKIKDNPLYHQRVRTGKQSLTHKYSDQCLNLLRTHLGQ